MTVISEIKGGSNVDLRQCLTQISLYLSELRDILYSINPSPEILAVNVSDNDFFFSKSTSLHINVWICFIWKIVTFYDLQYIKTNIKYNAFSLLFIDVFNTLYLSLCYRAIAFCFFFFLYCHQYPEMPVTDIPQICPVAVLKSTRYIQRVGAPRALFKL